jgi:hypothetical protein
MNSEQVLRTVGKMVRHNSVQLPDGDEAKQTFNDFVLGLAGGAPASELVELTDYQIRVLLALNQRGRDTLPSAVSKALGVAKNETYAFVLGAAWFEANREERGIHLVA